MNTNLGCANGKQRSGALHLTQKVDYGLILLIALAKNAEQNKLSIKKIANESGISFLFLQKIAGLLQKAGLIKADRGKYGGYKLAKSPKKLSLKDIIEAVEGKVAIVPCLKSTSICKHKKSCDIRHGLAKINQEIQNTVINKTLNYFI